MALCGIHYGTMTRDNEYQQHYVDLLPYLDGVLAVIKQLTADKAPMSRELHYQISTLLTSIWLHVDLAKIRLEKMEEASHSDGDPRLTPNSKDIRPI